MSDANIEFHAVATTAEVTEDEPKAVSIGRMDIGLYKLDGEFYAIDDICTHDGGTLSDGPHEGCEIACPRHGAKFDLRNGKALSMPATQDTVSHQVKVEDGSIRIRLNES